MALPIQSDAALLSQRFYVNLKESCRFYGIKIGDLEESIGVPGGYFSRWRKSGITLHNAYLASEALHVPIDTLLRSEINEKIVKDMTYVYID